MSEWVWFNFIQSMGVVSVLLRIFGDMLKKHPLSLADKYLYSKFIIE